MADFQRSKVTRYSRKRIAEAHDGELMLFTTIGIGDGIISGDLSKTTELVHEIQRFPIVDRRVSGNAFKATCFPKNVTQDIYVRELGLYIADPEHEDDRNYDRLYSVTTIIPNFESGPDYYAFIPQDTGNSVIEYKFTLHTVVSSSATIEIIHDIGGIGIANEDMPGIVRSNFQNGNVLVNEITGVMSVNGWQQVLERITALEQGGGGTGPGVNDTALLGTEDGNCLGTENGKFFTV
jgi:hypothetical protein